MIVENKIDIEDSEVTLLGVKHADKDSAAEAKKRIRQNKPDWVGVELDRNRYSQLVGDIEDVAVTEAIKNGEGGTVALQTLLSVYQNKISDSELLPGEEMIEALQEARGTGIDAELIDQDVNMTFHNILDLSIKEKAKAAYTFLIGGQNSTDDIMDNLDEFLDGCPGLRQEILTRRNIFMAEKIRKTDFEDGIVVVGAGHVDGISKILESGEEPDLEYYSGSRISLTKAVSIGFPVLVISTFVLSFYLYGFQTLVRAGAAWILFNSVLAGIGALISKAHPGTVLVSAVSSPLASINPMVGTGMISAYIQAKLDKPSVADITELSEITRYRDLWSNNVGKIILVFVLTTAGSLAGSLLGSAALLQVLF